MTKSAQLYVMGEMLANKDARFVGLGGQSQTLACPTCRGSIDAGKVMRGEHDVKRGGGWGWSVVAAIAVAVVAQPQFHDGQNWSSDAANAAAVALGIAVGAAIYVVRRVVEARARS